MKDLSEIDEVYILYDKRYELSKLAKETGMDEQTFNAMNSRDRFMTLSYRLKESSRVHLASFFFGKIFETTRDMEALLNKTDCLLILGEFEEAFRFNCIGFELYLEDSSINAIEVEKVLSYQKAILNFSSERFEIAEGICEENIIKFEQKESFVLLCAVFIAMRDFQKALRVYVRYSNKWSDEYEFLTDTAILLLSIHRSDAISDFILKLYDRPESEKQPINSYLNNFYAASKNKSMLKKYFKDEFSRETVCTID